jgi:hypothetical protein
LAGVLAVFLLLVGLPAAVLEVRDGGTWQAWFAVVSCIRRSQDAVPHVEELALQHFSDLPLLDPPGHRVSPAVEAVLHAEEHAEG